MGRKYSVSFADTNTANTTHAAITSASTVRPILYSIELGCDDTPADQAAQYWIQRYTVAGTSTAFTPHALNPSDPASLASAGVNHSVEPTYTANAILHRIAVNQRTSYQWLVPEEYGYIMPATAANGLGLRTEAVTTAFEVVGTLKFAE